MLPTQSDEEKTQERSHGHKPEKFDPASRGYGLPNGFDLGLRCISLAWVLARLWQWHIPSFLDTIGNGCTTLRSHRPCSHRTNLLCSSSQGNGIQVRAMKRMVGCSGSKGPIMSGRPPDSTTRHAFRISREYSMVPAETDWSNTSVLHGMFSESPKKLQSFSPSSVRFFHLVRALNNTETEIRWVKE